MKPEIKFSPVQLAAVKKVLLNRIVYNTSIASVFMSLQNPTAVKVLRDEWHVCWDGTAKIIASSATNWRDYAKANWNEDFRSWAGGEKRFPRISIKQRWYPYEIHANGINYFERSFAAFEKAYPNYKWPKWPFEQAVKKAKKRAVKRRR
jgi:hypothetical protein